MENYKPVKGYESTHIVYNDGRIFKLKKDGSKTELKTTMVRTNSTPIVHLITNNSNLQISVAKVVAEAFLPNDNNYKWIRHKDGNNLNNSVENLEWCYNKPGRNEKIKSSDGVVYDSIRSAAKILNIPVNQLRCALLNGRKLNGLSFSYVSKNYKPKESKVQDLPNEVWKPLRETNGQYMISNLGRVKAIKRQHHKLMQERLVTQGVVDNRATIKTRTYLDDGKVIRRFFTVINEVARHFKGIDPESVRLYNKDGNVSNCASSNIGVK